MTSETMTSETTASQESTFPELTAQEVYATYFPLDYCIGCGKEQACYTDPETGYPLCLACIEDECDKAPLGLHYNDPLFA